MGKKKRSEANIGGIPNGKKKVKKHKYRFLIKFLFRIAFLGIALWYVLNYVIVIQRVSGNSMYPALRDGDLCIYYRLGSYSYDDVICYTDDSGNLTSGRVIAVGGQWVDFGGDGSYLVCDNYMPDENMYDTYPSENVDIEYPVDVLENSVFVLNDYRSDTSDSREIGTIGSDRVQGVLVFVFRRREF